MNRRILRLSVPSIIANITVPLVGIVDIAISGRLGNAAAIGGIAIGTMLFDLLYWNFGFLRVGTGGLTAQSYGRKDFRDSIRYFTQGIATALASAMLIWAIQYFFVELCFLFIDCSPEVEHFARQYFFIRVWAAPATLSLFVFKGWFIGMQNTISPMVLDITVNVLNLGLGIWLGLYTPLGFLGIAIGILIAQYVGLLLAIILFIRYYKKLFRYFDIRNSVKLREMKSFYSVNGNLFIRSLCFMAIYSGFTSLAAHYGDTLLAVSSIMMKLLLLYSYFIDGFAYAGEALSGKYIGARDKPALTKAVKYLFYWAFAIGLVSTVAYALFGEWMVEVMTTNADVVAGARPFLIWLVFMPLISCAAFMWDGIYIGATATKAVRNGMIFACIAFFSIYFILKGNIGIQALWYAYFAHLLVRTLYMSFVAKKQVFARL